MVAALAVCVVIFCESVMSETSEMIVIMIFVKFFFILDTRLAGILITLKKYHLFYLMVGQKVLIVFAFFALGRGLEVHCRFCGRVPGIAPWNAADPL